MARNVRGDRIRDQSEHRARCFGRLFGDALLPGYLQHEQTDR
ncbi:MAG: hypothetical protein ACRDRJ_03780 [Streptosporangiaceae bacterium]